jgi:hypothetical protein
MPTPNKPKRTTICIPRDLWKRVRRDADELDIPVQKWMEEAARQKLEFEAKVPLLPAVRKA